MAALQAIAIIPARYGSTRFPAKPLARETGKYLVQHVYEAVRASKLVERVIVATDDERIVSAAKEFGAEVALTPPDCPSGTDRCAQVAARLRCDLVLNVQGDEPEMDPRNVDALVRLMESEARAGPRGAPMGTLAVEVDTGKPEGLAEFRSSHVVKVVTAANGRALYFSRSPIPFDRGRGGVPPRFKKHLGIYAYFREFLAALPALFGEVSPLERAESLEQLRVLEAGHAIAVGNAASDCSGIDTPEQYAAFVARWRLRHG